MSCPLWRRHLYNLYNMKWFSMKRFSNDTSGASAMEYGLVAALVAVAVMVAVNSVGYQTLLRFHDVIACIDQVPGPCPPPGTPPPPPPP